MSVNIAVLRMSKMCAWFFVLVSMQASSAFADEFFVYSGEQLTHSANSKLFVKVGEKLPAAALKKRFSSYKINMTAGEDCLICGVVIGPAGSFEVYWNQEGTEVVSVLSTDKTSSDSLGNIIGTSLGNVIGSEASCLAGLFTTCRSKFEGLAYVPSESEECQLKTPEAGLGETTIPACATIAGFIIKKNASVSD